MTRRPSNPGIVLYDGDPGSIAPRSEGQDLPPDEWRLAERLLRQYQKKRAEWRGHLHSFLGVNAGLAAINVLTAMGSGSLYPWFLYVTASWGIGLVIHGLQHRSWVKDAEASLEQAEALLGVSRQGRRLPARPSVPPPLPAAGADVPAALPAHDDGGWTQLVADCTAAVDAARQAIDDAEANPETLELASEKLAGVLETVEGIQRGALAIRRAILEVAPAGLEALEADLGTMEARIAAARDARLRAVHEANLRLLVARRDRIVALREEEERMRATVEGSLLAAQNIRLDAIRLGAGHVPALVATLSDALDRLRDEVEVARQVERDLETL